ncbi:MAG: ribose-phosphate pyrophosphokinase [Candidatus Dadabacteria bacterium]|nr:MAG: ribose-phosphate pyrophosphokinase [Candidatus Dadabacteria bacterium]
MSRELITFSGRSNPEFASSVARHLGIPLGRMDIVQFSDREILVEVAENVRGRDVFLVQSLSTPGNDHIMELLLAVDALRRASAWRITAVIPYFAYARQDRKLKPRVPISAKLLADLITTAGANRVLTMELHAGQIMGFFNIPVDNLNAIPIFLPYLRSKYSDKDITVVSPDMGGVERARSYATRLGNVDIAVIDKRRPAPGMIAEMKVVGEVKGKTAIIVDDMVDTAGTLVKAAETLLEQGAKEVIACAVHPVLSGQAVERLSSAPIKEVIVSDTIKIPSEKKFSTLEVLSVAPLFAEAIRRIHGEDSISSLFK